MKHPFQAQIPSSLGLLRNRDFLIAGVCRFLGAVGYGAVVVSILLHLQGTVEGRAAVWSVTAFLLFATVPTVVLAPWAGRLADTRDSRALAVWTSLASAAAVVAMALSMTLLTNYLPALFLLTLVLEASLAVASPTWQALLPRIVGEDRVPRAMGSMQAALMLAQLAGPAVGGLLVGAGGAVFSFWIAGLGYLVLAVGAGCIHTRRGVAPAEDAKKESLLAGLRILTSDRLLRAILIGALFVILGAEAINVLDIFLARDVLGATEAEYGLLSAALAAGMVGGSLLAGQIRTERLRLAVNVMSVAGAAITLALMGLAPNLAFLYLYAVGAGACIGALNATFGALMILRTREETRGRISAMVLGLTRAVSIAALGVGGILGTVFEPRTGFVLCGAATFTVAAVLAVVIARLCRQGTPEMTDEASPARPALAR